MPFNVMFSNKAVWAEQGVQRWLLTWRLAGRQSAVELMCDSLSVTSGWFFWLWVFVLVGWVVFLHPVNSLF